MFSVVLSDTAREGIISGSSSLSHSTANWEINYSSPRTRTRTRTRTRSLDKKVGEKYKMTNITFPSLVGIFLRGQTLIAEHWNISTFYRNFAMIIMVLWAGRESCMWLPPDHQTLRNISSDKSWQDLSPLWMKFSECQIMAEISDHHFSY